MMTAPRGTIDRTPAEMGTTASQYMTRITYCLAICELAMSGKNINQFFRCLTSYSILLYDTRYGDNNPPERCNLKPGVNDG